MSLFDPYGYHMNFCNELCLASWFAIQMNGQLVVLVWQNFQVRYYKQTFQSISFVPTMLVGTIDFHHFIPLSLTLIVPGGHKVSAQQTSWLHFLTRFNTDQDEI